MAARADTEEEVGRGGADDAARLDLEIEAGRGDADSAARPVAGEGVGGEASECPASQIEVEASKEVLNAGTSEVPHHGAIIQSGVPLEFLRNEQEEEAVWEVQFEAGSQILNHLDRALELHRTTDFQISQVGGSLPRIVCIWP